jgi:hypothetical protein
VGKKFKYSSVLNMYRIVLLFVVVVSIISITSSTPLDDYVNKPDPNFSWKLLQTYPSAAGTVYILNMTSQQWMDGKVKHVKIILLFMKMNLFLASFSTRPIWWHYMIITVPKVLKHPNIAFLNIGGGNNNNPYEYNLSRLISDRESSLRFHWKILESENMPNILPKISYSR